MSTETQDKDGWPIRVGTYVRVEDAKLDGKYHVSAYRGIVTEIREDWLHGHVLMLKCEDGYHCAPAHGCTVLRRTGSREVLHGADKIEALHKSISMRAGRRRANLDPAAEE